MSPDQVLDRAEACSALGISRQTLISWIRRGKLKIWKRVGHGSNAALLFERKHIDAICRKQPVQTKVATPSTLQLEVAPDTSTSEN
jgi:predicted site-specific integrase-resolvase